MKILYLNHNTEGRGTYFRCFQLAAGLVKQGHQVTLLTSNPSRNWNIICTENLGVKIMKIPDLLPARARNGGLGPFDTLQRMWHVVRESYDIIHAFDHRPSVSFPSLIAKYIRGEVFISDWTDWWGYGGIMDERPRWAKTLFGRLETHWEVVLRRKADGVTVICKALNERALTSKLTCPIVKIPGGADIENLKPITKKQARLSIGLPQDIPILAYVGFTQYDRKLLLDSFQYVAEQEEHALLVLIGPKSEDAEKHPYSSRIIQTGVLAYHEIGNYLSAADILLLPYSNRKINVGRWPNKVGDYMSVGRPILSNSTGDMIDLFLEAPIGLLSSDDPNEFAEKAIELIRNPEFAEQLGNNGRKLAEEKYSWYSLSKRLNDFYNEVLQIHSRRD